MHCSIFLTATIIEKKIKQKEKLWNVIRYTKGNIICGNIFKRWFGNIRECIIYYLQYIIYDSFTITLREIIFARFFSGKKLIFTRINFREATESRYSSTINFRESKIPKKEKSFSHIENLF